MKLRIEGLGFVSVGFGAWGVKIGFGATNPKPYIQSL